MENFGHIEIIISGKKGNIYLSPEIFDIKDLRELLKQSEKLIFLGDIKDRPLISYEVQEGSVKNIFKTSLQFIIAFNAVLGEINSKQSIDFLDLSTARAIEYFQYDAKKNDFSFEIKTSLESSAYLKIDSTTNFYRTLDHWAEAEFYFYGKITDAGGKEKANIHLNTEEYGVITIDTPKDFLENYKDNMLYKTFAIRAKGKQNTETGEIDKATLEFIDLIDHDKNYDAIYLQRLRDKAKNWINNVGHDDLMNDFRGYDA